MAASIPRSAKQSPRYFHGLEPPPAGGGEAGLISEGKRIYEGGVPSAGVPACANCHGADAKGAGNTPRLAGQLYVYAVKVLTNWAIINKERDGVKSPVEHQLSEPQIAAVSSYLSNLK